MTDEQVLAWFKEAGGFTEPRPLIEREYYVFPCIEDLHTFLALAKEPPRSWKPLSTAEVKVLWNVTKTPTAFAEVISNKLKEKNQNEQR